MYSCALVRSSFPHPRATLHHPSPYSIYSVASDFPRIFLTCDISFPIYCMLSSLLLIAARLSPSLALHLYTPHLTTSATGNWIRMRTRISYLRSYFFLVLFACFAFIFVLSVSLSASPSCVFLSYPFLSLFSYFDPGLFTSGVDTVIINFLVIIFCFLPLLSLSCRNL